MQLDGENVRRQEEEAEILAAAKKIVADRSRTSARASVLVVAGDGWHRGVIGIVASKLVDAFHRPAIVLSIDGDVAHGSCRSIPRFDMLGALERCAHLLIRFGGHKQAAGLTMEAARIRELRARGQRRRRRDARARRPDAAAADRRRPRRSASITGGVAAGVAALAPFGAGNPRPVFAARGVEIVDGPRKLKERHLKMSLKQDGRDLPRHRLARGRAARLPHRAQGRARRRLLARAEPLQRRDLRRADARRPEGWPDELQDCRIAELQKDGWETGRQSPFLPQSLPQSCNPAILQ